MAWSSGTVIPECIDLETQAPSIQSPVCDRCLTLLYKCIEHWESESDDVLCLRHSEFSIDQGCPICRRAWHDWLKQLDIYEHDETIKPEQWTWQWRRVRYTLGRSFEQAESRTEVFFAAQYEDEDWDMQCGFFLAPTLIARVFELGLPKLGYNVDDSQINVTLAKVWLDDCLNNHRKCKRPPRCPARLLHVDGHLEDVSDVRYAVLSGGPALGESLLPVHHEMLALVRQLGMQYAWIEGMDRNTDVFMGATLVIAMFDERPVHERDVLAEIGFRVDLGITGKLSGEVMFCWMTLDTSEMFEQFPRPETVEPRVLAARFLGINKQRLFWDCACREDVELSDIRWLWTNWVRAYLAEKEETLVQQRNSFLHGWLGLIREVARCGGLELVQGIADEMGRDGVMGRYRFGMWERLLWQQLWWYGEGDRRDVPSYSWASMTGKKSTWSPACFNKYLGEVLEMEPLTVKAHLFELDREWEADSDETGDVYMPHSLDEGQDDDLSMKGIVLKKVEEGVYRRVGIVWADVSREDADMMKMLPPDGKWVMADDVSMNMEDAKVFVLV